MMVKILSGYNENKQIKSWELSLETWHLKKASKASTISIFQVIWTKNLKMGAKIP